MTGMIDGCTPLVFAHRPAMRPPRPRHVLRASPHRLAGRTPVVLAVVLAAAMAAVAGASKCGLDACNACASGLPEPDCAAADEHCQTSFCLALCLGTWQCVVTPAGCSGWDGCAQFDAELNTWETQDALCAQLKGYACHLAECCTLDAIDAWMESHTYGDEMSDAHPAVPKLPMPACSAGDLSDDESAARCSACKAAMQVQVDAVPAICQAAFPPTSMPVDQVPEDCPPFANAGLTCDKQVPSFQSYYERCTKVSDAVQGVKAAVEADAAALLCACAGCCIDQDPACPRSYTFNRDPAVPDLFEPSERFRELMQQFGEAA